jgi:gluconate 5-dehydrogenase
MKVLVTGGTNGLGLAMASALAAAGATVALTGRSGQRASAVAAELPGAVGIELDVRDQSSVARAVDQAWSRLGGIDMLVNNAGIGMRTVNPRFMTQPQGFWEVPVDGFRAVIETNLTGYFLMAREVTPRMLAADAVPEDRRFREPAVMGPPIVWLASDEAAGVHNERIIATEFERWLRDRNRR